MKKCLNDRIFRQISEFADESGVRVFVIGGFVRDCLMGNPSKDIDIVVEGSGIEFAKGLATKLGKTKLSYFKNFGTAMLRYRNMDIEFVGARKESYRHESRKPIVEDGSIEDDQKRRDFTINAMAFGLNADNYGELTDPFGGEQHLKEGIIVTPLEPDITFSDDPLRMFRAIRFATRFNFRIENECFQAIKSNRERIGIVSFERIMDELNKAIMTEKPSRVFQMLDSTRLLELVFPELNALKGVEVVEGVSHKDNFLHTLKVLDNVSEKSDNLWLRWSALLHDIAKSCTRKFDAEVGWTFHGHDYIGYKMVPGIFKRMKMPLDDRMKYVQKMVLLHLRPISLVQDEVSDSAIRRLLFDAGDDIDDLMTLCEADITSKNEERVQRHLSNFSRLRDKLKEIEEKDSIRNFQPPVSGDEIQRTFNIAPGPVIGIIKNHIKESILDGIIPNEYEAARKLMIEKGKELGLVVSG